MILLNSPVLRRGVGTNKVFLACVTKEVITLEGGRPLMNYFYCFTGLCVIVLFATEPKRQRHRYTRGLTRFPPEKRQVLT